jgi:signal transduction histidine kinase
VPVDSAAPERPSLPAVPPLDPPSAPSGRPAAGHDVLQPGTRRGRVWARAWPILLATFVGLVYLVVAVANPKAAGGFLVLQVTLGIIAIGLVPLRRVAPLPVALVIAACSCFTNVAFGAYIVAVVSLSTRRRWREIVALTLVWMTALVFADRVMHLNKAPVWWVPYTLAVVFFGLLIVCGLYIGGRRDLLSALVDRAETAEREQAARMDQARVTERTHIAREMHDVLAHRISLVNMHAGALAYRDDLSREQTAETAEIIRANAHLALTELRDVLGVLRDTSDPTQPPERPQPTLGALAELLEECTAAGNQVTFEGSAQIADRLAGLPEQVSRNAFRILQESLTNTRKHAPGLDVLVEIAGHSGGRLTLMVDNTMPGFVPGYGGCSTRQHLRGVGLIGLV